jgi:hypothetical protein
MKKWPSDNRSVPAKMLQTGMKRQRNEKVIIRQAPGKDLVTATPLLVQWFHPREEERLAESRVLFSCVLSYGPGITTIQPALQLIRRHTLFSWYLIPSSPPVAAISPKVSLLAVCAARLSILRGAFC